MLLTITQKMYEMGVRRAILLGSRPLGCAPAEIAQHNELSGECSTDLQAAAELFEPQVDQMVKNLNAELGTEVFISASTRLMYFDMMNNPQAYGKNHFREKPFVMIKWDLTVSNDYACRICNFKIGLLWTRSIQWVRFL